MSDVDAMLMSGDVSVKGASSLLFRGVPLGKIGEEIDTLRARVAELEKKVSAYEDTLCHSSSVIRVHENGGLTRAVENVRLGELFRQRDALKVRVTELELGLDNIRASLTDGPSALEQENARLRKERDALKVRCEELEYKAATIQTCKNGHKFVANSPEYVCPWCLVEGYDALKSQLYAMTSDEAIERMLYVMVKFVDHNGRAIFTEEELRSALKAAIAASRGLK